MENEARKMFAAVVVIMLCAVAIVGVGYAYTATTTNSGNNAAAESVLLTQTDYKFVDNVTDFNTNYTSYFDTVNTGPSTTKYILKNGNNTNTNAPAIDGIHYATTGVFYGLPLGQTDTLTAQYNGPSTAPTAYSIKVSSENLVIGAGWYIVITFVYSTSIQYALFDGEVWSYYDANGTVQQACILLAQKSGSISQDYTTTVYLCGKSMSPGEEAYASANAAPGTLFTAGSISFSYSNNTVDGKVTINKANTSLALNSSERLKILDLENNNTAGTIVWSSSDSEKVTVDANTGVIKRIAAGDVTITCTYNDGSAHTATCTVTS